MTHPDADPLLMFLLDACTNEAPRPIRSPIVGYAATTEERRPEPRYSWDVRQISYLSPIVTLEVDLMHFGMVPAGFGLSLDEAAGMAALGLCLAQGIEPATLLAAAQEGAPR